MVVTACTGYVLILVTDPAETDIVLEILTDYMQDAGARINVNTIDCNIDRTTSRDDSVSPS